MARQGPRTPRFLIGCIIASVFAIVAAGAAVIILIGKFNDIGIAANEAPAAERAYRAAGLPWMAADLRPPVRPEQNAAQKLKDALALFDGDQFNSAYTKMRKETDSGSLDSAAESLAPFQRAMDVAVQATSRPDVDFGRDMDKGPAVLFPEFAPMKGLAKAICIRAELEAAHRDFKAMTRDISAVWKLGVLTGREPILIGMLVQIAIQRIAIRSIQNCAYKLQHDRTAIQGLLSVIEKATPPDYAYAMRGEAFMGLAAVRNLKALGGIEGLSDPSPSRVQPNLTHLVRSGLPSDTMARAFATRHMQVWTKAEAIFDKYRNNPVKAGREMDLLVASVEQKKTASNLLNMIMFPVFSQAGIAAASIQAEIIANRALLTGLLGAKLPASMRDIPGVWTDPFNDKPMLFKETDDGFRVYSVGPNLKDDGGIFRNELQDTKSDAYDVGASIPPARRR